MKTPCVRKMQIIPPPLAAALHRSSHMLLYKLFTYNGGLYQAATRLFRIQIKRLDFRPPRGKGRNLCGHKRPQLRHIIYCAWRFSDVKEALDLGRCCGVRLAFYKNRDCSDNLYINNVMIPSNCSSTFVLMHDTVHLPFLNCFQSIPA